MAGWLGDAPMVGESSSNKSSVKRSSKLDFPTPLSPMSRSLNWWSN